MAEASPKSCNKFIFCDYFKRKYTSRRLGTGSMICLFLLCHSVMHYSWAAIVTFSVSVTKQRYLGNGDVPLGDQIAKNN